MKQILFDEQKITGRIQELGREITDFYQGKRLTAVVMMNGCLFFAADLLRQIRLPIQIDSFAVSSYANNISTGTFQVRSRTKLDFKQRHLLILDDILDTGLTLQFVCEHFRQLGPLSIRTCVLLDKELSPEKKIVKNADWCGFKIPDYYVVGYGLDSNEEERNQTGISYYS